MVTDDFDFNDLQRRCQELLEHLRMYKAADERWEHFLMLGATQDHSGTCFCDACIDDRSHASRRITEPLHPIADVPRCVDCGLEWCEALDASYDDPLDGLLCSRCRNRRK